MSTSDPRPAPPIGLTAGAGSPVPQVEIRVAGRLAARWSAWFDGLAVAPQPDGSTVLRGPVADQAALHGVLQKLRDLGVPLISLTTIPPAARATPEEH